MQLLEYRNLRVSFEKLNDRFQQSIELQTGSRWVNVLSSIEGTSSSPWPPSPPWQQIVSEPLGPNQSNVLLGVGLSGNGHWSIAVNPFQEGILLDVACKLSKPAEFLGCTWSVHESWSVTQSDDDSATLNPVAPSDHSTPTISISATLGKLSIPQKNHIQLVPSSGLHPGTHRWALWLTSR